MIKEDQLNIHIILLHHNEVLYVFYQNNVNNLIGRLIETVDLAKAVDLYQKAASVFEVSDFEMLEQKNITGFSFWIHDHNVLFDMQGRPQ